MANPDWKPKLPVYPQYAGYTLAHRMGRNGRSVRKSYKPKYRRFYINPEFQDALGRFNPAKWEAELKRPFENDV